MNFIYILFYLILSIIPFHSYSSIQIDAKDWDDIEYVCNYLFKFHPLSYTLFFDKPISFAELSEGSDTADFLIKHFGVNYFVTATLLSQGGHRNKGLTKAWKTLSKYLRFCDENYILVERNETICFINKQATVDCINSHINLFQSVFGQDFSGDLFIKNFKESDLDLHSFLNYNHYLIGILLGFGEHNAWLFQRRADLYQLTASLDTVRNCKEIIETEEEINCIQKRLQGCNEYSCLPFIMYCHPQYAADRCEQESIDLEKKYLIQSRRIQTILSSPDWVKKILSHLMPNLAGI
ncbi:MAG: hypothetical protein CK425_06830 [Parachlamydia sp.]|nr:MAG: hypothetical protein CK425_06830 [Parachlamydia sp.]